MRSLPVSELINQELITAFRKELGMVYNDFYMVLTDFDMKVKVCFLLSQFSQSRIERFTNHLQLNDLPVLCHSNSMKYLLS